MIPTVVPTSHIGNGDHVDIREMEPVNELLTLEERCAGCNKPVASCKLAFIGDGSMKVCKICFLRNPGDVNKRSGKW